MKWWSLILTAALIWPAAAGVAALGARGQAGAKAPPVLWSLPAPLVRLCVLFLSFAALVAFHETLQLFRISRLQTVVNVAMGVSLVVTLQAMLRWRAPMWAYLLPLLVPVLPQLLPDWATYWHGFMHSSIVYQIVEHGVPVANPLMATESLLYPYGHHALIAGLMRVVPISPVQAFILTDLLTLCVFALLVERAAAMVSIERAVRVFAVLFAVLGPSPFVQAPLSDLFGSHGFGFTAEARFVPLSKFIGINNNQLGLVFCALGLYGMLLMSAGRRRVAGGAALAVALLGSGFLYPTSWLNIVVCAGAAAVALRLLREHRTVTWLMVAVVLVTTIMVLPFLWSITHGKSTTAAIQLVASGSQLLRKLAVLLSLLSLAMPLAWYGRTVIGASVRQWPTTWAVLAAATGASLITFLAVSMPDASEYKFLQLAIVALALPLALALHALCQRNMLVALVVMLVAALPYAIPFNVAMMREPVSDSVYSDGRILRHRDPEQDALYRWIVLNIPRDATMLDSYLTIPALARRPLLIGLDLRRELGRLKGNAGTMQDGWMMSAREFLLNVVGVEPNKYARLRDAAEQVLTSRPASRDAAALEALVQASGGRPLYLVVRDSEVNARLASQWRLRRLYAGRAASVYRVSESKLAMISTMRSQARPSP